MKDSGLMPCEVEHGFDAEGRQKRNGHGTEKSRSQWRGIDRRVVVGDEEAKRVIVTSTGHRLHLFEITQTRLRRELKYEASAAQ